jgi:hypothetical protein
MADIVGNKSNWPRCYLISEISIASIDQGSLLQSFFSITVIHLLQDKFPFGVSNLLSAQAVFVMFRQSGKDPLNSTQKCGEG